MIYSVCATLALIAACAAVWRHEAIARNPTRWRDDLAFEAQVRLVKRYLRRQGWTMRESLTWLNVFVRCNRGHVWLNLIVHDRTVLRVGTVVQDFIQAVSGNPIACGLLTREFVSTEIRHEMARYGMFVIRPEELADAESHVASATRVLAEWTERRNAEKAAVAARIGEQHPDPVTA